MALPDVPEPVFELLDWLEKQDIDGENGMAYERDLPERFRDPNLYAVAIAHSLIDHIDGPLVVSLDGEWPDWDPNDNYFSLRHTAHAVVAEWRLRRNQPTAIRKDSVHIEDASPSSTPKTLKQPLRQPSKMAFAAYTLHVILGKTQDETAMELQQRFRKQVTQGQVSRWAKEVSRFLEGGGTLPLNTESKPVVTSVDPSLLELGKRSDSRKPRKSNQD